MEYTISIWSLITIGVDIALGFIIPFGLYFVFKNLFKCVKKAFFEGMTMAIIVGLLLKQLIHSLVLSTSVGDVILNNGWLYGLYAGLVSALLEESVRIFAFRKRLGDYQSHDFNALMYGAGQGGAEAIYSLVVCLASTMQAALLIYRGQAEVMYYELDGEALESSLAAVEQLCAVHPVTFLSYAVERCAVVVMHMSLSVLMWFGIKKGGNTFWRMYAASIVLHVLLEMVAPVLNQYGANLWIVELGICLAAAVCAVAARIVWKQYHRPEMPE